MEKKKINQEDLNLNPEYYRNPPGKKEENDNVNGFDDRDHPTPSEQIEGEGTTCVSNVCPETVNCIPTISVGEICVEVTEIDGCAGSQQNCGTQATCKVSACICLVSDECKTKYVACEISADRDCIYTKGNECEESNGCEVSGDCVESIDRCLMP